jgi:UDP-2,4-diacetamido-2,4,6-trideoxy-beta-L-altropyranose hydrolase
MRVAIRTDGSAQIGGGHIMRCLSLADKLIARGCEVAFLVNPEATSIAPKLREFRGALIEVNGEDRSGNSALLRRWPEGADAAIVDHYGLSAPDERRLRGHARAIVVIDDLIDRPHDCDLLLDTSAERTAKDYAGLVPANCRLLLGPAFAMLRQEFLWARPLALERRRGIVPRKVLISMGLTDVGGITGRIAAACAGRCPGMKFVCVVGPQAASMAQLEVLAGAGADIEIEIDPESIAALMTEADYAIGAAGTTAWERCFLGLPSTTATLAENQYRNADLLRARAAAAVIAQLPADPDAIAEATAIAIGSGEALERMAANAAAICEHDGASAVADALFELLGWAPPVSDDAMQVIPASAKDALPVWCWRNDRTAREASLDSSFIGWNSHRQWFAAALASDRRILLMGQYRGSTCGYVRFDRIDDNAALRVSISLAPDKRGMGLGKRLLARAIGHLDGLRDLPRSLRAEVRTGNASSMNIFAAGGFAVDRQEDGVVHLSRDRWQ